MDTETQAVDPAVETQAREMGWAPRSEWRGDPEKFIEADEFVRRGETIVPILRANNKRLETEVGALRGQLASLQGELSSAAESIQALKDYNSEATRRQVKLDRAATVEGIRVARESGDLDQEIELQGQLREQDEALAEAETTRQSKGSKPSNDTNGRAAPEVTSELKGWMEANPWFKTDIERSELAIMVARRLRGDPANAALTQVQFLEKVKEGVNHYAPFEERAAAGKVGATSRTAGGRQGKTIADLPADARAAMDKYAKTLVGPGKAFKTTEDWQKKYLTDYFAGEE